MRVPALALLLWGSNLWPHTPTGKAATIDDYCQTIRHEFVETAPRYFSGPDPWVALEKLPDSFADVAIANVYSEGPRVRWLVLEMAGPGDGWFERTEYFFDGNGLIRKRERTLEEIASNVKLEESQYFQQGKLIKTNFRHAPLGTGTREQKQKEDWDDFYDPNAPKYTSTNDLPAAFSSTEAQHLANARRRFGLCTRCTKRVTERSQSLVKFSRPVLFAG